MAGTACGGMDQTISIMGKFNTAKLIDFIPKLKATDVKVPDNVSLVVANSLTPSAKILTVGTRYNKRVVECRFGVAILAIKTGLAQDFDNIPFNTFYELQKALGKSFEEMIELVKKHLKSGGYTLQMLQNEGDVSDPFAFMSSSIPHLTEVMKQNAAFYVYERAYHVFGEAQRVHQFKAICDEEGLDADERAKKLGDLMNASHVSCDMLYDCSSKNLNELVKLAKESGALGARLTGAGWGGCCVALVKKD
jgi:N-acetylgalactosamine kinase